MKIISNLTMLWFYYILASSSVVFLLISVTRMFFFYPMCFVMVVIENHMGIMGAIES